MLFQLSIRNFALIDQLDLQFNEKLNILTGETGAGKSIIIDAVSLLLGARAHTEFIRSSQNKALVEGTFYVPLHHPVEKILNDSGHELEEDRMLILTREILLSGKNICRLNKRIITLTLLKKISTQLINIYGQHDFQMLSQEKMHSSILDSLGNNKFKELLKDVEISYKYWQECVKKIKDLKSKIQDKNQRLDFLKFQIKEINDLDLQENEDASIETELKVLNNSEKIISATSNGYNYLYGTDSAYDKISKVINDIDDILDIDVNICKISDDLKNAQYIVEENARALKDYSENINFDMSRTEILQERKFEISKLKRKYGNTINEILEYRDKAEKEVFEIEKGEFLLEDLEKSERDAYSKYKELSLKLSNERKNIASILEQNLIKQLKALAMENTRFKVHFEEFEGNSKGIDKVDFLVSPNPGQPLNSLSKIASGGEMSRIMLALKIILAKVDSICTLIFDEIDSGIGGNIVIKVAEKLFELSLNRQVLCVTHSAQIAGYAHEHFNIAKKIINNKTVTNVKKLSENERIDELARMLGSNDKITLEHAKEIRRKGNKNTR